MKQRLETYLKKPYSRVLIPNDNGTYSAEILEFPGCFAEGNSPDEAIRNLEESAMSWIEANWEQGLDIPEPAMNQGYSGKVALRLPRSLHRQGARMAERDGTSLNQFLVTAIAARLGAEDFHMRLCERFEQRLATTSASIVINMPVAIIRGIASPKEAIKLATLSPLSGTTARSVEVIRNA